MEAILAEIARQGELEKANGKVGGRLRESSPPSAEVVTRKRKQPANELALTRNADLVSPCRQSEKSLFESFRGGLAKYKKNFSSAVSDTTDDKMFMEKLGELCAQHRDTRERAKTDSLAQISDLKAKLQVAKRETSKLQLKVDKLRQDNEDKDVAIAKLQTDVGVVNRKLKEQVKEAGTLGFKMYKRGYNVHLRQLQTKTTCTHWEECNFVLDIDGMETEGADINVAVAPASTESPPAAVTVAKDVSADHPGTSPPVASLALLDNEAGFEGEN